MVKDELILKISTIETPIDIDISEISRQDRSHQVSTAPTAAHARALTLKTLMRTLDASRSLILKRARLF